MNNIKILLSVLALASTLSACGNAVVSNGRAANTAGRPNTSVNNASPASAAKNDAKTDSAKPEAGPNKPAAETGERKEVLDALRIPVSKDLKQEIIFVVDKFKVQGDWAFVDVKPKNKDGGEPNWKITEYQAFIDSGDFEEGLYGLLKKKDGKWEVVEYLMNCHDVCYLGWETEHKAPKALFD